jgi:predicted transcriptional regulator
MDEPSGAPRRTILKLDPDLRERLAEIAREQERSLNQQIAFALREHVEREREQVAS